ncbi:MAG: hypothetical protein WCR36_04725 [Bacteroidaceae bacterium]
MDPLLLELLEKLMADGCQDYTLIINPPYGDFLYDTFVLKTKTLLLKKTKKLYDKYTMELVSDECEDDECVITIETLQKYLHKSKMRDVFMVVLDDGKEFEIDPSDYEIDDDTDSIIFNIVDIADDDTLESDKSSIDYITTTLDKEDDPIDNEILELENDEIMELENDEILDLEEDDDDDVSYTNDWDDDEEESDDEFLDIEDDVDIDDISEDDMKEF